MEKEFKAIKQSLDQTTMRNLDFTEKNKQIVRAAIDKEQRIEKRRKFISIGQFKYVFSLVASAALLLGSLYYILPIFHQQEETESNKKSASTVVYDKMATNEWVITFKKKMSSENVESIVHQFHLKVESFNFELQAVHSSHLNGEYTLKQNESFSESVKHAKATMKEKLVADMDSIAKKSADIKEQQNDPNSKGRIGLTQKNIDALTKSLKDRKKVADNLDASPLYFTSMNIIITEKVRDKLLNQVYVKGVSPAKDKTSIDLNADEIKSKGIESEVSAVDDYIRSVDLMNDHTGWEITGDRVSRTTDGGMHWKSVMPVDFHTDVVPSGVFLDSNIAMVFSSFQGQGKLYRTTDGSKNWAVYHTPFEGPIYPRFLTDQVGWVLSRVDGASGNEFVDLYKTTDGGKTWRKISTSGYPEDPGAIPYEGNKHGISFISKNVGFMTGFYRDVYDQLWLQKTRDGGETWNPVSLFLPKQLKRTNLNTLNPLFYNKKEGVLPVEGNNTDQATCELVFYQTKDGGESWNPSEVVSINSNSTYGYDFINLNEGWVIDERHIFSTHDGGKSWVTTPIDLQGSLKGKVISTLVIRDLDMSSISNGVLLVQDQKTNETFILVTHDGGKHWKQGSTLK